MRLHKIKNLLIVLVLGLTVHSCLNMDPLDQLAETNIWNTPSDYRLFANQFYNWTRKFNSALENNSIKPSHSDYTSDLFTNKDDRNRFSNGNNTIQASDGNYTTAYSNIRRTNLLLMNAEEYANPHDIAQYVGEAKFFRAYSYFDLLQLYGNAILTKKPMEASDPGMYVPQNDRGEVADFIIQDLKEAAELLPKFSELDEYGRISREGCQAFLSRVALYEGTWQQNRGNTERGKALLDIAAKAAKQVIDSKTFSIFKPESLGDSAQKYMFILEDVRSTPDANLKKSDNKEYIFVRRYDEVLAPIGWNISQSSLINAIWVNRKFANMYLCQNGLPITYGGTMNPEFKGYDKIDSEFVNRDNRMRYTLARPRDNFWGNNNPRVTWTGDEADMKNAMKRNFIPDAGTGYHNQKWSSERRVESGSEGFDYPIIRYAEVLLNYAEAVFERDGEISDGNLNISLNLVRCRVNKNMPPLTNKLINDHAGMDMRTEIRRERTIELFNEGFRLDDLKRWKTAEIEMPMDILGVKWEGTEYVTAWPKCSYPRNGEGCIIIESGRKWEERNYLFPLPKDQLQLNPKLEQNPGWK